MVLLSGCALTSDDNISSDKSKVSEVYLLEVKPKRVGGATYQVPREVKGDRKITLAIRWIIEAARSKKGKPMKEKLVQEIMDAAGNTGAAVRKKENAHRMAEANRAFAHFKW